MKRLILAAAVFLLPAAGITVLAQPAVADIGGECNGSNKVCLYESTNYNGDSLDHWANFATDDSNFNNNNWYDRNGIETNDSLNDEASSIKNRKGCTVVLYEDSNHNGTSTSWRNGANDGSLRDNPIGDNRASSLDMTC